MPFIPHTEQDIREMLKTIGVSSIEQLFDEIPDSLRHAPLDAIPPGLSEMELSRFAHERAQQDAIALCFIGAGAYDHYIPAAVWDIATRGEFYSAYTPYQAEASQGTLQLIYEYQTLMARLLAMDVSNASLYDGASALAEAILMAVRLSQHKSQHTSILMPRNIHPHYRATVQTIVSQQNIHLIDVPYDATTGRTDVKQLATLRTDNSVALVIPQPNFFGTLEEVDVLVAWARENNLLTIAVVNPLSMSLLKPPGEWGEKGVDIACGEGQPLGIPLASGGPYYGFLCCRKELVRQMPGRIVGRTVDMDGKEGFVLTLQAREQHIRRAKATSNICTNQGLMVTASTIFMSLLGPQGLQHIALLCHQHTRMMREALLAISGITDVFNTPFFHEIVVRVNQPVQHVLAALAKQGIQGGYALEQSYPELKDCLLLCATETKTPQDIQRLAAGLSAVLKGQITNGSKHTCPV